MCACLGSPSAGEASLTPRPAELPLGHQRPELLESVDALELDFPWVTKPETLVRRHQVVHEAGSEDLAAGGRGRDASRVVDRLTEELVGLADHLARVDANADL